MFGIFLLTCSVLAPFIFVILTSRIWPARTMMALPIMLAGLLYISQPYWHKYTQKIMVLVTGFCFVFYTASNTRLFYADYITWQNDKLFANRITSAIEQKFGDVLEPSKYSLVIIGTPADHDMPLRIQEETFGGSIFDWDGGNQQRLHSLFRIIGVNYFQMPSKAEVTLGTKLAAEMPVWPSSESIILNEQTIIVKLSEPDLE